MSELYHHGVSGMKWGKRNGPPYPLNATGKKSLAKQRKEKSSSKVSSGQAELDASINGKKKNNLTIAKDSKGRITSITGKIDTNSKTKISKNDIKKLTTKYSAKLMERESRYGLDFEDNRVPKEVRESVEYKRYKEAQEHYKKESNKNPDSTEAVQAYERLKDAGHDLSRLVKNMNESGVYRGTSKKPQEAASYKDKTAEEITIAKHQAIREGNVNEVQKNRDYYTDDEIRAAITRHGLNAELKDITAKHVKTGAEKVDAIISAVKKGTALAETGIDAYNVVAKITNSLGGDMPVIDGKKPDSQYNLFDKKTKAQLEEIISNPHKYTAKEIDGANDAYVTLLKAQQNVRADKNKNLTVEDVYNDKEKYTESEINDAMSRSSTLEKLWQNTAAKQEEAESYANMKAEVFKKVQDMNKPLSEIGKEYFEDKKPWWDDDKLNL